MENVHRGVEKAGLFSWADGSGDVVSDLAATHLVDDGRARQRARAFRHRHRHLSHHSHRFQSPRTDFKCDRPVKVEREEEPQKHLRHLFDEWPPKRTDQAMLLFLQPSSQSPFQSAIQEPRKGNYLDLQMRLPEKRRPVYSQPALTLAEAFKRSLRGSIVSTKGEDVSFSTLTNGDH